MSSKLPVLIGLGLVVVTGFTISWVCSRRKKWRLVGKLSELYIYPLKSGKYKKITEAECTMIGLKYKVGEGRYLRDRVFVVYNGTTMKFISAKMNINLMRMGVDPKDERTVIFSFPGKTSKEVILTDKFDNKDKMIELWQKEMIRINDCGDDIAEWVSDVLGDKDCRVAYWPEEETWRRGLDYRASELKIFKQMSTKYTGAYSDLGSYHIMNDASVDEMNSRLEDGEKAMALNFRPNFVIEGAKPYEEDKWRFVKIGNSIFESFRPCTRCVEINIHPDGLQKPKNEPLSTLRTYRTMKMLGEERVQPSIPVMGVFAGLYQAGTVKVGDLVYVSD